MKRKSLSTSSSSPPNKKLKKQQQEEVTYGLQQALPFSITSDYVPDLSKPAGDAEEYLRRVHYEAKRCQQIVNSGIDPSKYDHKKTTVIPAFPRIKENKIVIDKIWQEKYIKAFSKSRKTIQEQRDEGIEKIDISKFPHKKDLQAWRRFCWGDKNKKPTMPNLKMLLSLDYLTLNALFHNMVQWVIEDSIIDKTRCIWLHSLLLVLEEPLQSTIEADMNDLVVWLIEKHSQLKTEQEIKEMTPHLHILISIIVKYFKQGEGLL